MPDFFYPLDATKPYDDENGFTSIFGYCAFVMCPVLAFCLSESTKNYRHFSPNIVMLFFATGSFIWSLSLGKYTNNLFVTSKNETTNSPIHEI